MKGDTAQVAKKFDEIISEFLRIYGGETDFIRTLRAKNEELDSKNASDAEAEAALQELMTAQFRRINRGSLSAKRGETDATAADTDTEGTPKGGKKSTDAQGKDGASEYTPPTPKPRSAIVSAQETLKRYFDSAPRRVRYTRSCDSEDRIILSGNYILDNTIKLPIRIILERASETSLCTIHATLPLTVPNHLVFPVCKKISDINSENAEPVGAFYMKSDKASEDSDANTVYFKYTFIIDGGLVISDFEKYFNSACRSVLEYYDDILLCAKGHFKSSEIREILANTEELEDELLGQSR